MAYDEQFGAAECILFVAGDPVPVSELKRVLNLTDIEINALLTRMERTYREEERGVQLFMTDDTVQLTSNKRYSDKIELLLQPAKKRSFSQAMLETLAIVAYKQPVTRSDIEAIRGVRCEYAVAQLLRMDMIQELGRKDAVGRPMLFGTTDAFLRHFGIHSISELQSYGCFLSGDDDGEPASPMDGESAPNEEAQES